MADKQRNIAAAVQRYGSALGRFIRGRVPTDADAEDFTRGREPKEYSFNEAGRKAFEQGQRLREAKSK